MMAVAYSVITLVLSLLNGGGNDLIDYLPSESFWKVKQVDVTVDKMLAELAEKPSPPVDGLIAQLGSPDAATRDNAVTAIRAAGGAAAIKSLRGAAESADAEVRRRARTLLRDIGGDEIVRGVRQLMAIRTLGELGKPRPVPRLKELLLSKDLFVAEYAQVAIDRIEGRSSNARQVSPKVADDIWLVPDSCKTIGQIVPRRGKPLGSNELAASLHVADGVKKDDNAEAATRMVLSIAEKVGNVRLDSATFGVSGNVVPEFGGDPGYVLVILRGTYHSDWARTLAKSEHVIARGETGLEIFEPDNEQAWIMPSDEMFVFVASPTPEKMPVGEIEKAIRLNKGSRTRNDAIQKFVSSLDARQVLWAASVLTPDQRHLPVASAFETLGLVGTRQGKTLELKITARGSDRAKTAEAVDAVNRHTKESAEFLDGIKGVPVIDMAVKLLRTVQAKADGANATLIAHLETTPSAVFSLPMFYDETPEREPTPQPNPRRRTNAAGQKQE